MLKIKELINKRVIINDKGKIYTSAIQEVEEDYIAIAIPYFQRRPLLLEEGSKVELKLVGNGEFYLLQHTVIAKKRDTVPLYILSLPETVERVQQRNFVRIPNILTVQYKTEDAEEPSIGKTIDLSGGGMKLAVSSTIKVGTKLLLRFNIPGEEVSINVTAEVVRSDTHEVKGGKLRTVGLNFLDIQENTRDRIIAYIFSKMTKTPRMYR